MRAEVVIDGAGPAFSTSISAMYVSFAAHRLKIDRNYGALHLTSGEARCRAMTLRVFEPLI